MLALLFAILAALAGNGAPIPPDEMAGEVFETGAGVAWSWEWDGGCGEDYCWVIVTRDGRLEWNGGEAPMVFTYTAPRCPDPADEPCYVIVSHDGSVDIGP